MSKKSAKAVLIEGLATEAAARLAEQVEQSTGGFPTQETEDELASDEIERPLTDADFFDYCAMSYERKGKPIVFYIKKNGKYVTTLKPPLNWDKLRKLFGAGHYLVQCKDELTNAFLKQKTEILDELPEVTEEETVTTDPHPFGFMPQSGGGSDMAGILALMQTQSEQRQAADREQRIRDEAFRREERERDEMRRREERESRSDLLKTLIPAAAPIIAALLPKKDDKLETVLEIMKENQRNQQTQTDKLVERLERLLTEPKKSEMSPLEMVKLMNDAKRDGRKEMEELLDMVEERAERRAVDLAKGDGQESTLSLLLKNLGPGLAALIAQGAGAGAVPVQAIEAQEPALESQDDTIETAPQATVAPPPMAAKRPLSQDEQDQASILKILLPFFSEQFARISSNHAVDPKAAARESLNLLKTKGFSQTRVLSLFKRETLFGVLRAYKIPKQYDPWFNEYYDTLLVKEAEPQNRAPIPTLRTPSSTPNKKATGARLRTAPQKSHAEQDGELGGRGGGDSVRGSDATLGFIPAESHKLGTESKKLNGVSEPDSVPGAVIAGTPVGASAESAKQLPS